MESAEIIKFSFSVNKCSVCQLWYQLVENFSAISFLQLFNILLYEPKRWLSHEMELFFFASFSPNWRNSKLRLFRTWSRVREEISKQLSDELFVINYILDPWVIFRNNASVVANVGSRCELSSLLGERIKRKSPTFGVGSGIKIFLAELSRLVSCLLAPGYLWRYPSGGIGNGL